MSTPISVVGTVATDPRLIETPSKISVCSFRIACNERRYDKERGEWVDGETNWFTVSSFRGLAEHAHASFVKGDRVIVSGRLRVRAWENGEKSGTAVDIEADALGHDVRWGRSTFRKHRSRESSDEPSHTDTGPITTTESQDRWSEADPIGEPTSAASENSTEVRSSDGFTPAAA